MQTRTSRCRCDCHRTLDPSLERDRAGHPRVVLTCWRCRRPWKSAPLRKRPRLTLLGFLVELERLDVAWGLDRSTGQMTVDEATPMSPVAELWHHGHALRGRVTAASAPLPEWN